MGFTHECILNKNNPEIRKRLEEIGRTFRGCWNIETDEVIQCYPKGFITFQGYDYLSLVRLYPNATDCGTNEELFLAIAALRDDSDKAQWFVSDANQFTGMCMTAVDFGEFLFCSIDKFPPSGLFHKATVEELIKHFSK